MRMPNQRRRWEDRMNRRATNKSKLPSLIYFYSKLQPNWCAHSLGALGDQSGLNDTPSGCNPPTSMTLYRECC